ncbi:MAG: helix-turn-helix domain-containing protein [Pseudomonadota bacterium]
MEKVNAKPSIPGPDPLHAACPSRHLIDVIGDKWALIVMPALKDGPRRNGELMRAIGGISQKMLTQTLRRLEETGIVERTVFETVPPHVEYELTPLGRALGEALKPLDRWMTDNWPALHARLCKASPSKPVD